VKRTWLLIHASDLNRSSHHIAKNKGEQTTVLDRLLTRAVAIAAIIGIPVGLYGYFSSQHDNRVHTAFDFYKSFKSDEMQKNWSLLIERWNAKAAEVDKLLTQNDQEGLRSLTVSLVSDEKGQIAFEQISSFFDDVAKCLDNSLCDNNTTQAMLQSKAYQLASAYGYYIIYFRKTYNNSQYGTGLLSVQSLDRKIDFYNWF
jgi:hypothetical protein